MKNSLTSLFGAFGIYVCFLLLSIFASAWAENAAEDDSRHTLQPIAIASRHGKIEGLRKVVSLRWTDGSGKTEMRIAHAVVLPTNGVIWVGLTRQPFCGDA